VSAAAVASISVVVAVAVVVVTVTVLWCSYECLECQRIVSGTLQQGHYRDTVYCASTPVKIACVCQPDWQLLLTLMRMLNTLL
jgi:hypothetical protein